MPGIPGNTFPTNVLALEWSRFAKYEQLAITPLHCGYAEIKRYQRPCSMYLLWEFQISTLINSNNAEVNLFTFCKSSIKGTCDAQIVQTAEWYESYM
jgi:hypothetical protein